MNTILLNLAGLILTLSISTGIAMAGTPKQTKPIDPANMNTSVKPGEDFFLYANGGWMKNNPIPDEYAIFGAFAQISEDNLDKIKSLFKKVSSKGKAKKGSIEQLIGDYYFAGMNKDNIEKLGSTPVKPWLDEVDNIKSKEDLLKEIIKLHSYGLFPLFYIYSAPDETNSNLVIANLFQGGLGLRDRDYYFKDDKRSKEIREEYIKHLTNMFELIKYNKKDAQNAANTIFNLEKSLADVSRTKLELRDPQANYNKMDVNKLSSDAQGFAWNEYFKGLGITYTKEINVGQPKFFEGMAKLIQTLPINDWKEYLKWNIINSTSSYLSSKFVDESFRFYGKVMTGKEKNQERWKRVLEQTSGDLGEAVGQIYVKEYFPPEAKVKMLKLVNNLKIALRDRIKQLEWMSDGTKIEAVAKLDRINVKIGYPDKWINYSSVDITRDNYLQNSINAGKFNFQRELKKIGNPPDRDEWGMTPQTVNAYYSPNMNEIVFPAAILQPPFFDLKADDAVNYAAIGTVIGHEMTHGFDDQGRQYDKEGNLRDWWTAEDAAKFDKRVEILVKQFDQFVAIDTFRVNGKLTLGENIADLGGITVSFEAWKNSNGGKIPTEKIDGFTPIERFYLSYAQVWRNNIRDKELMRRLRDDVHSPGKYRVIGTLPNVPQFYETFKIKKGDKMYIPESDRAKIW
jgi:putative endopeptidase